MLATIRESPRRQKDEMKLRQWIANSSYSSVRPFPGREWLFDRELLLESLEGEQDAE